MKAGQGVGRGWSQTNFVELWSVSRPRFSRDGHRDMGDVSTYGNFIRTSEKRARERGSHRSQEQVEILKELATLIAARTTRGRPGQASVAVQQCMTQFGLYSDFKMTLQEVNRVAKLPEWTTVLEVMIKSRRADLAFRTTKQERWNQRAQDRQTHQDFLEEHRGTGKF